MTPSTARVYEHLKTGATGTAAEVARAVQIRVKTVRDCLVTLRKDGIVQIVSGPGEVHVYGWTGCEPKPVEPAPKQIRPRPAPQPEPVYVGGPIKVQALRSRTPLEQAWR